MQTIFDLKGGRSFYDWKQFVHPMSDNVLGSVRIYDGPTVGLLFL